MSETEQTELRGAISAAIAASLPNLHQRLISDGEVHLELIQQTARARVEVDKLLNEAVSAARTAGQSWESVGQALDMSRQAAQQRFGRSEASQERGTRRLSPLTAFNEIEILNRAGVYGWHSVGFGALYHDIEKSDQQWEHCRVTLFDPSRQALERGGWHKVGNSWFPWVYYARPTGKPAQPTPFSELDFFIR